MGVLGGLAGWELSLYADHEALGLVHSLLIEEAGVPLLWRRPHAIVITAVAIGGLTIAIRRRRASPAERGGVADSDR